jgi:hypothetical protein
MNMSIRIFEVISDKISVVRYNDIYANLSLNYTIISL